MFYIGEILKTKGNNGDVVLRTSPDFFFNGKNPSSIQLISKKYKKTLSVEKISEAGNDLVVKFTDIKSITDAYRLIGYSAYITDRIDIKKFKKKNLVDYLVKDKYNNIWGRIISDVEEGLTHILEIDDNGDIIYLPYSTEIIIEINKSSNEIIIDPPDGLRTLNK